MGFFSSTKPSAVQSPTPSSDGGFIAPDRDARAACWEGRDAFFRCLDSHGIIDSVKEDAKSRKACGEELRTFERDCAGSWVSSEICGSMAIHDKKDIGANRCPLLMIGHIFQEAPCYGTPARCDNEEARS
jgi:hypothetical protein